ncbi:unnamed protein product, partial [Mesorhabditis belari]|uniref:Uncharacterized protein n=1 Tax=Mesorhabditis belari TaxID=2138241 RepID=A0AAF3FM93_9BILA
MVLAFDKILQLRKFRGDHGNRSCEYQIVNGPPSNFLSHPELLLNTYRDTDVFQDQALTSPSYSIYIPPGCAPSIALMTYSLGTDATPRLRNCASTRPFPMCKRLSFNVTLCPNGRNTRDAS